MGEHGIEGPLVHRAAWSDCLLAGAGKTAQVALYGVYFGAAYSLIAEGGHRLRPLRRALGAAAREGAKTSAVLIAGIGLGCTACAVATGGDASAVTELSFRTAPLAALWATAWGGMLAHLQIEARWGAGGTADAAAGSAWSQRLLCGPPWARAGAAAVFASCVAGAAAKLR